MSGDAGACRSAYDICSADVRCKSVVDCILAADCLRQLDFTQTSENLPECATTCIEQANTTINAIVAPAAQFFGCATDAQKCRTVCFDE
jgi:hypothetical protein